MMAKQIVIHIDKNADAQQALELIEFLRNQSYITMQIKDE